MHHVGIADFAYQFTSKIHLALCKIIRDTLVKNRNVSAVNRQRVLNGGREKNEDIKRQWKRDRKQENN